ncbi:hypothetical protein GUITHDRAFT_144583, partial [Guillardia theta CCMP2712]
MADMLSLGDQTLSNARNALDDWNFDLARSFRESASKYFREAGVDKSSELDALLQVPHRNDPQDVVTGGETAAARLEQEEAQQVEREVPRDDERDEGTEDMQIEDSEGLPLKSEAMNLEEETWEGNSDMTGDPPSPPEYASESDTESRDFDLEAQPTEAAQNVGGIYVEGNAGDVNKHFADEDLELLRELEERKLMALKAIEASQAHVLLHKSVVTQSSQRLSAPDPPVQEQHSRAARLYPEAEEATLIQEEKQAAAAHSAKERKEDKGAGDEGAGDSERSGESEDTNDSLDFEPRRADFLSFVDDAVVYYRTRKRERYGKLGEMCWYIVFISIATSLLLVSQSSLVGQMHATQVKMWLNKSIESVTTVEQVLPYLKNILIDRHYVATNIAGNLVADAGMFGMSPHLSSRGSMLGNNIVVGLLELRQWRAPEQYCKTPTLLGNNFKRCFPELDPQHRDIRSNPPGTSWPVDDDLRSPAWSFFQLPEFATPIYSSFDRSYEQGSYIAVLPDAPLEAEKLFADLIKYRWLDGNATRAVQLEFSTYNPNVNIWSACSVLFEQSFEGRLIRTIFVRNADICPSCSNISQDSYVLTIVLLVLVILYTLLQLVFLQREGIGYFFRWHNLVSCVNLVIFYVVIAVQVWVKSDADQTLLGSQSRVTTQIPGYVYWLVQTSYWNSFNALLLWVKLLKFCDSTSYKAETLVVTFFRCLAPFLALACCYSIAYGGFVLAFTLILGPDDLRFYSYMRTARTQFSMLSGSGPHFKDIPAVDGANDFGLISIIGVVYQLGMKIFGLGFFVGIILYTYQQQ